ncbi:hypothetical protein B0H67DRAFT_682614 [Lasiosphaeris hirsuta]|uniref:Interferon-related developmental regulator N-terminal domain-containing protein n=1 Tax=Lasiosphaeris hirsuta TaxID=260670 RepID=A0AA40DY48_9PEZI|nr:hypothetical protein B0H67DRAFT_682614 [Lasiosphaeris hirsuta]
MTAPSEEERKTGIQAIAHTLINNPTQGFDILGDVFSTLEDVATSDNKEVKIKKVLDFLLEIMSSDDRSVHATYNAKVVIAVLQAWVFGAIVTGDLTHKQAQAFEVLFEQLESTEIEVQCSTGAVLAYLFEAGAYEEETVECSGAGRMETKAAKYRVLSHLVQVQVEISRSIGKQERRKFRSDITTITTSLESGIGPYLPPGAPCFGAAKMQLSNPRSVTIDTWRSHFILRVLSKISHPYQIGGLTNVQWIIYHYC